MKTPIHALAWAALALSASCNLTPVYACVVPGDGTCALFDDGHVGNIFGNGVGAGANASLSEYSSTWASIAHVDQNAITLSGIVNNGVGASAKSQYRFVTVTANSNVNFTLSDNAGVPTFGLSLGSAIPSWSIPSTAASGWITSTGTAAPTLANGTAAMYASATNGGLFAGKGSSNDLQLVNNSGQAALSIPTGTQNVMVPGAAGIGPNGSLSAFGNTWALEIENDQNAATRLAVANNNTGASAAAAIHWITGTANSNAKFQLVDNAAPTFSLSLGSAMNFWQSPPIKSNGSAPTCSSTGTGTGPSCAVSTGSNSQAGKILITTGTTPGNSGTFTITFAAAYGTNIPACVYQLANTGTAWNARASTMDSTSANTAAAGAWDNNAVNLTASVAYHIGYVCFGK
jgi:hypothetical protein